MRSTLESRLFNAHWVVEEWPRDLIVLKLWMSFVRVVLAFERYWRI